MPGPAWGEDVLCALPRYIGALSLAYLLCFTLYPSGLGAGLYYIYIFFGEMFVSAVRLYNLGPAGEAFNALTDTMRPYLLSGRFYTYGSSQPPPGVEQSWLTGLVWLAVTTAVGLWVFRRREIK